VYSTGRFVERVRALDPSYKDAIPWQPRGYSRKRSHGSHMTLTVTQRKKLCSPLLEQEMVIIQFCSWREEGLLFMFWGGGAQKSMNKGDGSYFNVSSETKNRS